MIPVVVLAGFLGAGKTTLLNHLLRNRAGVRVGVLVNDFGAINVDAMSVDAAVDSTISLGNGCICCAADTDDVDEMLLRFTDPEPKVDVIIVEASGLAEPQSVVRMILASENRALEYGGLIEVIDAVEFADTLAEHPVLRRHLAFADLVLLNKKDRVDAPTIEGLRDTVAAVAPGAPVVPTEYGAIDPRLLLDNPLAEEPAARQLSFADIEDDHREHLHAGYTSTEFVSAQPMDPRALLDFFSTHSADIYRIKGFVYFGIPGHEHKFTVHTVGRHLRFHRGEWASDEQRITQLVLIGAGMRPEAVHKDLAECVHTRGADHTAEHMLAVYRHTRS